MHCYTLLAAALLQAWHVSAVAVGSSAAGRTISPRPNPNDAVMVDPTSNPLGGSNLRNSSVETLASRDYFYVGGTYSMGADGQRIMKDQLYVEHLSPGQGPTQLHPLVFLHGGGSSGAIWLNTPDRRKGWASYFLEQGYAVYLVDVASTGRSSRAPGTQLVGPPTVDTVEKTYTAPRLANQYPQAAAHTQWPGTGVAGDPIFDSFYASFLQISSDLVGSETAAQLGICALLKRIGPAHILAHALASASAFAAADFCQPKVSSLILLDPVGPTFETYDAGPLPLTARPYGLTMTPLQFDPRVSNPDTDFVPVRVGTNTTAKRSCLQQPAPARKLVNLSKIPTLMLVGEASVHVTYDHCVADFLKDAGVNVTYWPLNEKGLYGNGLYFMIEKNNLDIASLTRDWILDRGSAASVAPVAASS